MSSLVKAIINGTCPSCNTKLPPLERYNSTWPVVDCENENCDEWFNVIKYQKAGGQEI